MRGWTMRGTNRKKKLKGQSSVEVFHGPFKGGSLRVEKGGNAADFCSAMYAVNGNEEGL